MALTGLDFSSTSIQILQAVLDPSLSFIIMERNSIDLNKHAFDLNEVPSNDPSTGFPETSTSSSASQENPNPWLPKKGGWLELFHNMFGPENCKLPFDHNSFPWNPNINNCPQLDLKTLGNVRMHNTPYLNSTERFHDNVQQNVVGSRPFPSLLQLQKSRGAWKPARGCSDGLVPPPFGNIFHIPIMPIPDPVSATPIVAKSYNGGSLKPGCRQLFSNQGSVCSSGEQPLYNGTGSPKLTGDVFSTRGNSGGTLSIGQTPLNGSDQLKPRLPIWDLNSIPISQTKTSLPPTPQVDPSGIASFGNSFYPMYELGQSAKTQVFSNNQEHGIFTQPFLKEFETKFRQGNGFMTSEGSSKNKDRFISSEMKSTELINSEILESSSDGSRKGMEPRIRVISSPDWLPAGWITELKTRRAGSTAGTTDKYYKDPVTGHRFRSKNEVMSFLQTGQTCRLKLHAKNIENSSPLKVIPALPPQEHGAGLVDALVTAKHRYLTHANGHFHESLSSKTDGFISERNPVKLEQDDILQVSFAEHLDSYRPSCMREGSHDFGLLSKPPPAIVGKEKCDFSVPFYKRKLADNNSDVLLSKRVCSRVEKQDQGELPSCSTISLRKDETSTSVGTADVRLRHTNHPVLLFKTGQNCPEEKPMYQSLLTRYMSNETMHSSPWTKPSCNNMLQCKNGYVKDPHIQKGLVNKCCEKKFTKLTVKQERELFISLGRKLCLEFLASAKRAVESPDTNTAYDQKSKQ